MQKALFVGRNNYGRELFYASNDAAKAILAIAGKTTLPPHVTPETCAMLGFELVKVTQDEIAAELAKKIV